MGIFQLCNNDPLVTTLSEVFRANILRVPEARLQPLCVIGARNRNLAYRGRLGDLIAAGSIPELDQPELKMSEMANVAGKRSRQVDSKLGLEILGGFLSGFGVSASAGIQEQFSGAAALSFSFGKVQRRYLEPSYLGKLLAGRSLDAANPVAGGFLQDDGWDCLLVDSVIASSEFSIQVERRAKHDFQLDAPAIADVLASAGAEISVAAASTLGLTFKGSKPLSFAFTCQRLILGPTGQILRMPPDTRPRAFAAPQATVLLADGPVLLEWDE